MSQKPHAAADAETKIGTPAPEPSCAEGDCENEPTYWQIRRGAKPNPGVETVCEEHASASASRL